MNNREYKCHHCGGVFTPHDDWTEEVQEREYQENFSAEIYKDEDRVVVCDDCYKALMREFI